MADLFSWARQRRIAGVGTSFRPSLALFNGRLYAAWKGVSNDTGIYWASSDGRSWTGQQRISGVGTSVGPSLAVFGNQLYARGRASPATTGSTGPRSTAPPGPVSGRSPAWAPA